MVGPTKIIHAAPRIVAAIAAFCAIAVVSLIAQPQALMQTALSGVPAKQTAFPDTIVDPDHGQGYRVLTGLHGDSALSPPVLSHDGWFAHVDVGDRITISDPGQALRVLEITDVRPLGAALSKYSGAREDEQLVLVVGKLIGGSDPQTVRLLLNIGSTGDMSGTTALRPRSL